MLQDGDLVLRPYRHEDKDGLVREANNPDVSRYLADRFPCPYGPAEAEAWLGLLAVIPPPPLNLAIEFRGRFAGGIGLEPMGDVHRGTAVLGYWLGEPFWGRGLATRATGLFVPWVFRELPFVRIQAQVYIENAASMRVLEKNGFTLEGIMRRHITKRGRVTDAALYARLRPAPDV